MGHLWFLDPAARALAAFQLKEGQWLPITSLSDDDAVSVPPFDLAGLWIPAAHSGASAETDEESGTAHGKDPAMKDLTVREQRVLQFVRRNPGATQREMAEGIYGHDAMQNQVHHEVNLCLRLGYLRRENRGCFGNPYRYYPKDREQGAENADPGTPPIYKTVKERIVEFVSKNPGTTQREIAEAIFGKDALQRRVNEDVKQCVRLGYLREEGKGNFGDPYFYYSNYPKDREFYIPRSYTGDSPDPYAEAGSAYRKDLSTRQKRVVGFVSKTPGKTQREIAKAIYGPDAVQNEVNQDVNRCVRFGLLREEGLGGLNDPFRYYPKDRKFHTPRSDTGDSAEPDAQSGSAHRRYISIRQKRILEFVSKNPGKTLREIAEGLYGRDAVQAQVKHDVNRCVRLGDLRREGLGGHDDPYRYYSAEPDTESGSAHGKDPTVKDLTVRQKRVLEFVSKTPGKTQREIAKALYGPDGYRQRVNQDVRQCMRLGALRREGRGVRDDPHRYYPTDRERGAENA